MRLWLGLAGFALIVLAGVLGLMSLWTRRPSARKEPDNDLEIRRRINAQLLAIAKRKQKQDAASGPRNHARGESL